MTGGKMASQKLQLPIAVGCVIDDRRRVLLIRRCEPEIPYIHNKWEFPGGKIEFGENPSRTAEREILEETGVHVEAGRMLPFSYVAVRKCGDRELNPLILCFRCKLVKESESGRELPLKVKQVRWVPIAELDPLFIQSGTFQFLRHVLSEEKILSNEELERYSRAASIAYITMRSVDPSRNRNRFYSMTLETNPVLETSFRIHIAWGRIASWAQTRVETFGDRDDALEFVADVLTRRKSNGYSLKDKSPNFPELSVLAEMPVQHEKEANLF
jgi:8-oxo-dGTP diphosphatase